jgi:hypothetical protein
MDTKGQRPLGRDEFNTRWAAELAGAPPFVRRLAWEAICVATAESGTELTVDSALDFVAHVGERSHASGAAYLNRDPQGADVSGIREGHILGRASRA